MAKVSMNCKWFGPSCSLLAGFCLGGGFVCVSPFPSLYSTCCQFTSCILFAFFPASSPPCGLGGARKHLVAAKPPHCPQRTPVPCSASCKVPPQVSAETAPHPAADGHRPCVSAWPFVCGAADKPGASGCSTWYSGAHLGPRPQAAAV